MYVGVFLHVTLLVEAFAAILARIGPGVGVDEEVGGEGGGALEALAALLAREDLFRAVHGPARDTFFKHFFCGQIIHEKTSFVIILNFLIKKHNSP